ncbi:YceI family protein [Pseudoduganella sp. UC29_106]|uniref:YceI family protein n=1 Tax=Pseudoduganella sp. UC29_106 TaxID=3374553 RepID=UPI0037583781
MQFKLLTAAALLAVSASGAFAATYNIDPSHTYPSFEADHKGLSVWRGKFDKTTGTIQMDRATKTGTMDIIIDAASINFGLDKMNSHAKSPDMFNVEKFPTVTYKGKNFKFDGEQLVAVEGELTMLGVTKPVTLKVNRFKCVQDQRLKREICGADATAEFKRTDFGLNYATPAFAPEVKLAIQVEAIKSE